MKTLMLINFFDLQREIVLRSKELPCIIEARKQQKIIPKKELTEMSEQTMQNIQQQEEMRFHIGTDGKRYPDPTPANYPWFGLEHLQYIQKHQPEFYQEMVTAGKMNEYLNDVEMHAH